MKIEVSFILDLPDDNYNLNDIVEWVNFELGNGGISYDSEMLDIEFNPEQIFVNFI